MRAMQHQMLGLGVDPGPVSHLACHISMYSVSNIREQQQHQQSTSRGGTAHGQGPQQVDADAPETVCDSGSQQPAAAAAGEDSLVKASEAARALDAVPATAAAANKAVAQRAAAAVVACNWQPPAALGEPPVHKYVLERFALSNVGAAWELAAELDDTATIRFNDNVQQQGHYQYRMSAWNLYGRSAYVFSAEVTVKPGRLRNAEMTDDAVTAGTTSTATSAASTADSAPKAPSSVVQKEAETTLQLQEAMDGVHGPQLQPMHSGQAKQYAELMRSVSFQQLGNQHTPGGVGTTLMSLQPDNSVYNSQRSCQAGAGDVLQQHLSITAIQKAEDWYSGGPANGVVARQQGAQGCHAAAEMAGNNDFAMPGMVAQLQPDTAAAPAVAQACGTAGNGPNVVWVIGQGAFEAMHPCAPGAVAAQAQLLAATAASGLLDVRSSQGESANRGQHGSVADSTRAVTVVGSAMLRWLWRVVNSLLVLLLPVGMRLLPVHVLRRMAPGSLWLLQMFGRVRRQQPSVFGRPSTADSSGNPQSQHTTSMAGAEQHHASQHGSQSSRKVTAESDTGNGSCITGALVSEIAAASTGKRPNVLHESRSEVNLQQCRAQAPMGFRSSFISNSTLQPAAANELSTPCSIARSATSAVQAAAAGASMASTTAEAAAVSQSRQVQEDWAYMPDNALSVSEGLKTGKKWCTFPGCQQRFDLRHLRALLQRHYCGRCQQAFCINHTAYSPHGASGSCGAESQCVCAGCFYEFTPEYRIFLSSRNTLVSRRSRSGPVWQGLVDSGSSTVEVAAVGGMAAASSGSVSADITVTPINMGSSAAMLRVRSQHSAADARARQGQLTSAAGTACGAEAARAHSVQVTEDLQQPEQQQHQAKPEQQYLGHVSHCTYDKLHPAAALDELSSRAQQGVVSRMLWGRGWTKVRAVVRLKHAVRQQH
eukprot:GHRR01010078.1.p1 GENE.GHRR01010078.1~~GHRR01010078.1.p1  ORF type:complete len:936 (+),score=396.96 GHRR01010078.1:623-3430(+)